MALVLTLALLACQGETITVEVPADTPTPQPTYTPYPIAPTPLATAPITDPPNPHFPPYQPTYANPGCQETGLPRLPRCLPSTTAADSSW